MNKKNNAGFTLFEIIIVIAILSILAIVVIYGYVSFKKSSDLNNNVQEFVSALRVAQNKTLSSENSAQYGVYIDTEVFPEQYILFRGASYAGRDPSFAQIYFLQNTVEFYGISLGGGNEIVFNRLTGASEESGSISIRIKTDIGQNKTVYVANSGTVGFNPPTTLSDGNRVKDSRHVQFNYSRTIDTVNENIILTFDNSKTEVIPISSYLMADELQWKGTVNVGGTDQTIEINTHQLNNPNTVFSIRRDKRYNNKGLEVTISGDISGYLAQYSADGLNINYSSIYVSDLAWQ